MMSWNLLALNAAKIGNVILPLSRIRTQMLVSMTTRNVISICLIAGGKL